MLNMLNLSMVNKVNLLNILKKEPSSEFSNNIKSFYWEMVDANGLNDLIDLKTRIFNQNLVYLYKQPTGSDLDSIPAC